MTPVEFNRLTVDGLYIPKENTQNILKNKEDVKKLIAAASFVQTESDKTIQEQIKQRANAIEIAINGETIDLDLNMSSGVLRHKENFQKLTRDVLLYAGYDFANPNKKHSPEFVKEILEKNDYLNLVNEDPRRTKVSTWGSHRGSLPSTLQNFARIAKHDTLKNNTINITGGGLEAMEAPLRGAYQASKSNKKRGLERIAFDEPGIILAEPFNKYVQKAVIFPTIQLRKMGFIGGSDRLYQLEGGVGTLEEDMTLLSVLSHPENKGMPYLFDIILHDKEYKNTLENFFKAILPEDFYKKRLNIHFKPNPKQFAEYTRHTNKRNLPEIKPGWKDGIYFPEGVIKMESVENADYHKILSGLNFSKDQDLHELLLNLEKFFHYFVTLTIKVPEKVLEWKNDPPVIKGDAKIIETLEKLIDLFKKQNRLVLPHGKFYRLEAI